MSWRNTNSNSKQPASGRRKRKPKKSFGPPQPLEPRLLLGTLVPTDTGSVAGDFLPLESADLLTPVEQDDLAPVDAALLELQKQQLEVQSKIEWLARLRAQREQAESASDQPTESNEDSSEQPEDVPTPDAQSTWQPPDLPDLQ